MNRVINYIPPTTFNELINFQKLDSRIKGEVWSSISIDGWERFKISNYGRLLNAETNILRKCRLFSKPKKYINCIGYTIITNGVWSTMMIPDLLRLVFLPGLDKNCINPIPLDGNIFNLHLDNIDFIPNAIYKFAIEFEKPIHINGELTKYTIDIFGVIKNQKNNKIISASNMDVNEIITISHRGKKTNMTRARLMAEALIPNPNNLKFASTINDTITTPTIYNICWTNRPKEIKKNESKYC